MFQCTTRKNINPIISGKDNFVIYDHPTENDTDYEGYDLTPPKSSKPISVIFEEECKYDKVNIKDDIKDDIKEDLYHIKIDIKDEKEQEEKKEIDHIKIEIKDDKEKWTNDIENMLVKWSTECSENSIDHEKNESKYIIVYWLLNIPVSVIPASLAVFSNILDENSLSFSICLVSASVLSTTIGIMNPGQIVEQHGQYKGLFNELSMEINVELSKERHYRSNAHLFLQKVMDKYNYLNSHAP